MNGGRITAPRQVERLLHSLRARHATLAAQAGPHTGSTLILGIDFVHGALLLDGLFPPEAQAAVVPGAALAFSTRLDGAALRGQVRVRSIEERPGGPVLHADLPAELEYVQRRAAYRVQVHAPLPPASLLHQGLRHRALLLDVSVLGLGARIDGEPAIAGGARMTCELQLPGAQMLAELEVRSARHEEGFTRIGGRYVELAPRQRALLEQATAQLQRATLQRVHAPPRS
jgi:c-di-GMP-binding flagellar brake protein YcgR